MLDGLRQFIADIVAPSADPDLSFDDTGYRLAATALLLTALAPFAAGAALRASRD